MKIWVRLPYNSCIQDTLSSRAALGLPSASREQRYLAYKYNSGACIIYDSDVTDEHMGTSPI